MVRFGVPLPMSMLDAISVLILAYNVLRGLSTGLLRSAVNLLAVAAATFLVLFGPPWLAGWTARLPISGPLGELVRPAIAWVLVFVAVSAVGLSLRRLLKAGQSPILTLIDRLGGAMLGLCVGTLLVALPLVMLGSLPLIQQLPQVQSALGNSVVATALAPLLSRIVPP